MTRVEPRPAPPTAQPSVEELAQAMGRTQPGGCYELSTLRLWARSLSAALAALEPQREPGAGTPEPQIDVERLARAMYPDPLAEGQTWEDAMRDAVEVAAVYRALRRDEPPAPREP